MKKALGGFIAVAALALAGWFFANNSSTSSTPDVPTSEVVTILKYNDYQCPTCKNVRPMEKQLLAEYGDKIDFQYRHFPLDMHQYAPLASRAVEAAMRQDAYEGMHERIFEEQAIWSAGNARQYFFSYAEDLGLDMEQFEADIDSEEIIAIVESQLREGNRRLVTGTPTYFINGRKINGIPANVEQFKDLVDLYLEEG
jgi:protein-disulfide isomerase